MKGIVLSFLVTCSVLAPRAASGGDGPKPLEPKAFFETLKGQYYVELVGGKSPVGKEAFATVDIEGDQAVLTMPFCKPILCDPGYVYIPFSQAQVVGDGVKSEVSVGASGDVAKFSWEVDGTTVVFRNYQYQLRPWKVIVLEHVLRKVSREEETM